MAESEARAMMIFFLCVCFGSSYSLRKFWFRGANSTEIVGEITDWMSEKIFYLFFLFFNIIINIFAKISMKNVLRLEWKLIEPENELINVKTLWYSK